MGRVQFEPGRTGSAILWIHAASVGEVQAAAVLIKELLAERGHYTIVLTTVTEYGMKVAEQQLSAEIRCFLAPLDVPCAVRRFFEKIRPDMYIGMETELWPALLTELRHAAIPCVLLNGRMSDRSFRRYSLVRGSLCKLLDAFSAVSVIQESDKERFAFFGVPEKLIQVSGNIKYDFPSADGDAVRKRYRELLGLTDERVFLCGSTRSGEENILAEVFLRLQKQSGKDMIWLVAPRHLDRLAEVRSLLVGCGLSYDLFSELKNGNKKRECPVVLVDTMGDLAGLYSAGDYIFCGGSMVAKGGHNIMEAARWGMPVYFGPNMDDFRDAAELLEKGGAGFRVSDGEQLLQIILRHMENAAEYDRAGKNALAVINRQQGSARRQAEMVRRLLSKRQH